MTNVSNTATGFAWKQLFEAVRDLASDPAPLRDRLRETRRQNVVNIEERGVPPVIAAGLAEFNARMDRLALTLPPTHDLDFEARAIAERVLNLYDRLASTMHDRGRQRRADVEPPPFDQAWELLHRSVESMVQDNGPVLRRLVWGYQDGAALLAEFETPPDIARDLQRVRETLLPVLAAFDEAERRGTVPHLDQIMDTRMASSWVGELVAIYSRLAKYQDETSVDDDLAGGL